jgi:hypothetical protein
MSKKLSFIQALLSHRQALTAFMVVGVIVLGLSVGKFPSTSLLGIQPAVAQRVSPGDVWQQVYQKLPDLPKENQYINKETGKVAENNTLASRLIRYHIYVKERAPNYRLDWKLTLADYLDVNEIMYETTYPGNDTLRQNPIDGDRAAIARLNRHQRYDLVQVLANLFNPNSQNTLDPNNDTITSPSTSTPKKPQSGGAQLLR